MHEVKEKYRAYYIDKI